MKRSCLLPALLCSVLVGCVLPEYRVFDSNTPSDTTMSPNMVPPSKTGIGNASTLCTACIAAKCTEERTECGEQCDELSLPVSPAWVVPDEADSFVQCLARECEEPCNVRWGCVGSYSFPVPANAYSVRVRVAEATSNRGVKGATVTACQGSDPNCGIGAGMDGSATTDADGYATLALRNDFFGYFVADGGDSYFVTTLMWSQPTYRVDTTFTINLFAKEWLDVLLQQVMVKKHDDAGHMIFRAENCLPLRYIGNDNANAEADGVIVNYAPNGPDSSRTFYTTYALSVDPVATATQAIGSGYGGAVNLPPGLVSIVGSHDNDTTMNAVVRIRPDALGLVMLVPNAK
jgi:hypothetical protein